MRRNLPNIILIVLDSVGAKHLSVYGYHRQTTPNLERLAEECMVYTRCFAPACWTIPSHASLFTGLYPSRHGAYEGRLWGGENVPHLVSILKMSGYRTLGISANGLVSPATGLCRDFDYFEDLGVSDLNDFLYYCEKAGQHKDELSVALAKGIGALEKSAILLRYMFKTWQFKKSFDKISPAIRYRIGNLIKPSPQFKSTLFTEKSLTICRDLLNWHYAKEKQPFFLFINFIEAHDRYCPPLKFRKFSHWYDRQPHSPHDSYRKNIVRLDRLMNKYCKLYDDAIYYLDHILNQIWVILKELSLVGNTFIIITSDHGEHFGEKRMYNHISSLYNELIWVPLIMRLPKEFNLKGVDSRLVSLTDLYQTILDLIDSPMPTAKDSISLLSGSKRELAVSQNIYPEFFQNWINILTEVWRIGGADFSPHDMAVITASGLKIIERRDGSLEVYDLNQDMGESRNLVPLLSPETLEDCHAIVDFHKKDTNYHEAVARMRLLEESQLK
jgi:arylsulfatase A-like enzyme